MTISQTIYSPVTENSDLLVYNFQWKNLVINLDTLILESRTKYFEQSKETKQYCTWLENFNICFCVLFDCYCRCFISGRGTGNWAMSPPNSEIFSIFPNFPDLARLKPFINLYSRIHVYKLCYARYKNLFYWWWMKPALFKTLWPEL